MEHSVILQRGTNGKFGLSWQRNERVIRKITVGGAAHINGEIDIGDEIYAINDKEIPDDKVRDIGHMLSVANSGSSVKLTLRKPGKCLFINQLIQVSEA